jgi:hypothetical protein
VGKQKIKQADQEHSAKDYQRDGDRLEGQASWSTMGLQNSLQNTSWNVTIPAGLREDMPLTC